MIFETHAHYDDHAFDADRDALLQRLPEQLIETVVNVGSSIATSKECIALAQKYPYIYAAVGVHPEELQDFEIPGEMVVETNEDDRSISVWHPKEEPPVFSDAEDALWRDNPAILKIYELAKEEKVVSIGEIGLDYYWIKDEKARAWQRYFFMAQLVVAKELDLPVIVHSRDAAADTMEIMKKAAEMGIQAVIHCYSYALEQAREYVKLGFYIGIGGVVTFKNSKKLKEVATEIPLDHILVETDCPYMAPAPFRGMRNDSSYIPYVIRTIAKLREITEHKVMEQTRENGYTFYRIKNGRKR